MAYPAKKEQKTYSYADYLNWNDDERWELINGIAYNMSPAPSPLHQEILGKLHQQIINFSNDNVCKLYMAPFDVRFAHKNLKNENILTVVQPDIVVICDKEKLDEKGCIGSPDLIIEIISPTSAIRDARDKLNLYEKEGVKEYWIVYPDQKIVMIFKLNKNNEYGKPETYSNEDIIETNILPGFKAELSKVFES